MGATDDKKWKLCHGEALLPDALEKVGDGAFDNCPKIKTIWVRDGSVRNSLKHEYNSTAILLKEPETFWKIYLWDLRRLKSVVIP